MRYEKYYSTSKEITVVVQRGVYNPYWVFLLYPYLFLSVNNPVFLFGISNRMLIYMNLLIEVMNTILHAF